MADNCKTFVIVIRGNQGTGFSFLNSPDKILRTARPSSRITKYYSIKKILNIIFVLL
nr:MAG TPA: hypothetical protein [Herelleviridae sp.]